MLVSWQHFVEVFLKLNIPGIFSQNTTKIPEIYFLFQEYFKKMLVYMLVYDFLILRIFLEYCQYFF